MSNCKNTIAIITIAGCFKSHMPRRRLFERGLRALQSIASMCPGRCWTATTWPGNRWQHHCEGGLCQGHGKSLGKERIDWMSKDGVVICLSNNPIHCIVFVFITRRLDLSGWQDPFFVGRFRKPRHIGHESGQRVKEVVRGLACQKKLATSYHDGSPEGSPLSVFVWRS